MKFKGLLFDIDGTLVTTRYEHRKIVLQKTLEEYGKEIPLKEIINKFWFEGNRDEIVREIFGIDKSDFWKTYAKYDTPGFRKIFTSPFYDIEVLPDLKREGYKLGIVTSAPGEIADLEVGMIGKSLFDSVVVAHVKNGFLPKPNPEGIIKCLNCLELKNNEAIFVGNSDEDIGAAKNANVFGIHLDRREYKYKNLKPGRTVYSLYSLERILATEF
ncbi:MAG: HAD family hydrolase [Nanoarchaeota archaeon]|nr:HAD family hydrolase [Nanoarchaeota archaeon]